MVIEESSVIAASSKAAKMARKHGGFTMKSDESYSIGQVQVVDVDTRTAVRKVLKASSRIIKLANSKSKTLSAMNKGAKKVTCRKITSKSAPMLIVELLIDAGMRWEQT